jgi:hypothetical protein
MEPIKLMTSTVAIEELEKGLRLLPSPWYERIAHDLRIIHTRKDEINAALEIMPLVREWYAASKAYDGRDDQRLRVAEHALAAALASAEEGGCSCTFNPPYSDFDCPIHGTGKEKPHD